MNNRKVLAILRLQARTSFVRLLYTFDCFLDLVCGCLCGENGTHSVRDFLVCSKFGFVRIFRICFVVFAVRAKRLEFIWKSLGSFVFFRFGLYSQSERNDQSSLGNVWVCSNFGFVRIFFIWFVVFAERAKRLELLRKRLCFFQILGFVLRVHLQYIFVDLVYHKIVCKFWVWFGVAP